MNGLATFRSDCYKESGDPLLKNVPIMPTQTMNTLKMHWKEALLSVSTLATVVHFFSATPSHAQRSVQKISSTCPGGYILDDFNECTTFDRNPPQLIPRAKAGCPSSHPRDAGGGYCKRGT